MCSTNAKLPKAFLIWKNTCVCLSASYEPIRSRVRWLLDIFGWPTFQVPQFWYQPMHSLRWINWTYKKRWQSKSGSRTVSHPFHACPCTTSNVPNQRETTSPSPATAKILSDAIHAAIQVATILQRHRWRRRSYHRQSTVHMHQHDSGQYATDMLQSRSKCSCVDHRTRERSKLSIEAVQWQLN